jgi:hypothetical protein|tara:strand:+ start:352 stop:570 length:219 start_codon:yes stop_codon:yes gene_type:complete
MQEGPKVTTPSADPENLEEVNKHDAFMKDAYQKEMGDTFESFSDGVVTGEQRIGSMHPFDPTLPWPDRDLGE